MEPTIETTGIPGLVVLRLPVHEDARGWFTENWHRATMTALRTRVLGANGQLGRALQAAFPGAREIFVLSGRDAADVATITTDECAAGKVLAPRPVHSTLRLEKLTATGFEPEDAVTALRRYCSSGQRP